MFIWLWLLNENKRVQHKKKLKSKRLLFCFVIFFEFKTYKPSFSFDSLGEILKDLCFSHHLSRFFFVFLSLSFKYNLTSSFDSVRMLSVLKYQFKIPHIIAGFLAFRSIIIVWILYYVDSILPLNGKWKMKR